MDIKYATQTDEIKVTGMICRACEDAVTEALLHTRGVVSAKASYWKGRVTIEYDPAIVSREAIEKRLEHSGYPAGESGVAGFVMDLFCAALVAFLTWFLLARGLGPAPDASGATGLAELFVIGLLTSTHCLGMCGGILLSQTTDSSGLGSATAPSTKRGVWASLAYNGGRLASYTLMGGVFGALGLVVTYTVTAKSIVFTLAGGAVVLIGLAMSGVAPGLRRLSSELPGFCSLPGGARKRHYGKPLVVGLLTGLMPCGPLYAMWLYAMGSGSFLRGGAVHAGLCRRHPAANVSLRRAQFFSPEKVEQVPAQALRRAGAGAGAEDADKGPDAGRYPVKRKASVTKWLRRLFSYYPRKISFVIPI